MKEAVVLDALDSRGALTGPTVRRRAVFEPLGLLRCELDVSAGSDPLITHLGRLLGRHATPTPTHPRHVLERGCPQPRNNQPRYLRPSAVTQCSGREQAGEYLEFSLFFHYCCSHQFCQLLVSHPSVGL